MLRKILASVAVLLASLLSAAPALAATDCTGTVAYVTEYGVGTSPVLYVALTVTGGSVPLIGFYVGHSDASYTALASLASMTRMSGATVTMTFAASSVNCAPGSFSWRSDLTAFKF